MGKKLRRILMRVSIAGENFVAQPGWVIEVDDDLARKWISVGHATAVPPGTPLSQVDLLVELSADDALRGHACDYCQRRGEIVMGRKILCRGHYFSELEFPMEEK